LADKYSPCGELEEQSLKVRKLEENKFFIIIIG
jgi:hypothetical protein